MWSDIKSLYKLRVTVLVNTVVYSIDTISGEDKYRHSLKSNPMACVCIYYEGMYIFYVCIYTVCVMNLTKYINKVDND